MEWYTCGRYTYYNNNYNTICIGPFANAKDADSETFKVEIYNAATTLVPVCKFMPNFMKRIVITHKVNKILMKSEHINIYPTTLYDK